MPSAVALVGTLIGGTLMAGSHAVVGFIITMASNIIASAWSNAIAKRKKEDDTVTAGTRTNTRTTQAYYGLAYGKVRIGGNDVFIDTIGKHNKHLWIVQVLGEGECDSIQNAYINDKSLYPTNDGFGDDAEFYFHNGSGTQTVDTHLQDAVGSDVWDDNLIHTTYIVWHFQYDSDKFSGLPQRSVVINGLKLYDFRTGVTQWSNNIVLCLYDYLTNTRYGVGIDPEIIDYDSWKTTADYVDDKGWTYNRYITGDMSSQDIIDDMLMHFRGVINNYDGKLYLDYTDMNTAFQGGKYAQGISLSLRDDDIAVDTSGLPKIYIERPSRYNAPTGLRVKFVEIGSNNEYVYDDIIVGDDNEDLEELRLEGCTSREMAGELGTYYLERKRENTSITGVFRDSAIQLDANDIVKITSSSLDFENEIARVVSTNIQNNGLVQLQLARERESFYNKTYDANDFTVFNCTLPDRNDSVHITIGDIEEEVYYYRERRFTRIFVPISCSSPWFDYAQVWVSTDGGDNFDHIYNVTNDFFIDPVEEGLVYYIKCVGVSIFGVVEDWATAEYVSYDVAGYTSRPASLSYLNAVVNSNSVSLYANTVSDADISLYEFRLGSSWHGGIFLGASKAPNLTLVGVKPSPDGSPHTFVANTKSNNGLYGEVYRSTSVALIDPPDGWEHNDSWQEISDDYTDSNAELFNVEVAAAGTSYPSYLICSHDTITYEYLTFTNSIMAIFQCDEGSGTTTSSYVGSYSLTLNTGATWAGSTSGYSKDAIKIEDSGSLSYSGSVGDDFDCDNFAFCAWLKSTLSGDDWVSDKQLGIAYRAGKYKIYAKTSGDKTSPTLRFYAEVSAGGTTDTLTSENTYAANSYQHICVTYDGADIKLYINGNLTDTLTHSVGGNLDSATGSVTYFGYDGTNSFYGYLDEIIFNNDEFTLEEVEDIYNLDIYQGVYKSPVFNVTGTDDQYLLFIDAIIQITGTGTTWNSKFKSDSTYLTGRQGGMTTKSWREIFEISEGAKVQMKALCSSTYDSTWPDGTKEISMMEILTGIVDHNYYGYIQVIIKIEDPSDAVNAWVEPYVLNVCEKI